MIDPVIKLPVKFVYEHLFVRLEDRTPFLRQASLFEDFVIRCVRYAFANIPASIGRVFFSKPVALPFLRFRMLRHGYLTSPIHWHEVSEPQQKLQGLWIIPDKLKKPDIIIYYAHGGGFSMGSSYFYLEFFLAWIYLLKQSGFQNPAIFALEYTLVPDECYPTQLLQATAGYKYVLSIINDPSRICVSGDSAGATIILSLLLHMSRPFSMENHQSMMPGMATMISPWVTLNSPKDKNTLSDYLAVDSLHLYAQQYVGPKVSINEPIACPGNCKDLKWWSEACPSHGFVFYFGSEEVLAPEIRDLISILVKTGARVDVEEVQSGIHAWPVATLFLSSTEKERLKGLKSMTSKIRERILSDGP